MPFTETGGTGGETDMKNGKLLLFCNNCSERGAQCSENGVWDSVKVSLRKNYLKQL